MDKQGTFELIGKELVALFDPIKDRVSNGEILLLFAELGIQFPTSLIDANPGFIVAIEDTVENITVLSTKVVDLKAAIEAEDFGLIADLSIELTQLVTDIIEDLETVTTAISTHDWSGDGLTPTELSDIGAFATNLIESLLDYLLVTYLESKSEPTVVVLEFFGIVDRELVNVGSTNPLYPEFVKKTINFSNIGEFFKSPPNLLKMLYGWGEPTFDGKDMLEKMNKIFLGLGFPSVYTETPTELDVLFLSVTPYTAASPPGLKFLFNEILKANGTVTFNGANWTLDLGIENDIPVDAGLTIEPDGNLTLIPPSVGTLEGKLFAKWLMDNGADPIILLGNADASNLQAQQLSVLAEMDFAFEGGSASVGELKVEGEFKEGKIIIKPKNPDGFLAKILPAARNGN